jgi:SHS2 domain-containing protein
MPTLDEILTNAQFGDDLEFDFQGNKLKLGDVRKFRGNADADSRTAAAKRQEAERLANDAATLLATLRDTAAAPKKEEVKLDANDWRQDPLYAPVVKELTSIMETNKAIQASIEAQKKTLDQAQAAYALDRMSQEFDRVKDKDGRFKGRTYEEAVQEAVTRKDLDRFGIPTLRNLIDRSQEPDRLEAKYQEGIKKGTEEGEAKARANAPKPGGAAARFHTQKSEKPPIAKLDDLTAEVVAADSEIADIVEGRVQ